MDGVKLIVGDKCMGMLETVGEVFPDAKYQRCTVHFYRNVFSVVPKSKVKIVVKNAQGDPRPGEQRGGGPHRDVPGRRVSVHRVEDITETLWGSKVSPATISELNKKAYVHIEDWRNRPLQGGRYPYVYVDGIYLRRNWGGEYENVAILVAIAVNDDGFHEVLGAAEGMKEDKAS